MLHIQYVLRFNFRTKLPPPLFLANKNYKVIIVTIALLLTKISPLQFSRLTAITFLFSLFLSFGALYTESLGSGIGIYSGLYHVSTITQSTETFTYLMGAFIRRPWILFPFFLFCTTISFLVSLFILDNFKLSNNTIIRKLQLLLFITISALFLGIIYIYIQSPIYSDSFDADSNIGDMVSANTENMGLWIYSQPTLFKYSLNLNRKAKNFSTSKFNNSSLKSPHSYKNPLSLRERLFIGIKKGWNTNTLPSHIIKLQLNPLIRIFRVLGGMSVLGILTNSLTDLNRYILYIGAFITFMYFLYQMYISYHRVLHMYWVIKNKKFDIRHPPL